MSVWVWTFDPLQLAPLLLGAGMYAKRASTLARRGHPVPGARRLSFYAGLALIAAAFITPIDHLGEHHLLSVHMVQHILIGDLAALLVVLGVTGPILRPVLALPLVTKLRVLAHPLVALPLWALNLYVWHLPTLYESALAYGSVHALQHVLFFGTGALMWAALVEPLPGPAWFGTGSKALYVVSVRLLEAILANIFIWSGRPFYDRYVEAERVWGISALADQSTGGSIMMVQGSVLTLGLFGWLFLRWMREGELRQELVERGLDVRAVDRAVRYGRGALLSEEQLALGDRRGDHLYELPSK